MKKILLAALALAAGSGAFAQAPTGAAFHPAHAVTLVVPYSAGGGTDSVGRLFARQLGALWGQPVVVENRTGGSGVIGSGFVARAAPDGQTLLLSVASIVVNPYVIAKLPYDTPVAFTPITPLAIPVVVMVGSPGLRANDMKSFLALARKEPGVHTFASSEPSTQLFGEQVATAGNAKLLHVPYKGASSWLSDVMSNTVDTGFASITSAQAFMQGGKLKILGVAAEHRLDKLPNVPTFGEQGVTGLESSVWYGLFAPGKTPAPVVAAIYADVMKVLAQPETQAQLATLGALPGGERPEAFARRFHEALATYAQLTRKLGIQAE
jgi:tripartite-type tricarboxylate transporter receptor subunit TctC